MSVYVGPNCRLCRREGVKLFLKGDRCSTAKCAVSKKKKAPGNAKAKKGKTSYYGLQLREKQKLKRFYYMSEAQFKKFFEFAAKAEGNTGANLIQFLERRLDNVVYRLGIATSRKQARKMISYGLMTLNDKKVKVPSIIVKKGDIIKIRENRKNSRLFEENLKREVKLPTWLEKMDNFSGKVMELPKREEFIDLAVKEQMIIELYSK